MTLVRELTYFLISRSRLSKHISYGNMEGVHHLPVLLVFGPVIIAVVCAFVAPLTRRPHRTDAIREPPYIRSYIPLVGHLIGMIRKGASYFEYIKYDYVPVRVTMDVQLSRLALQQRQSAHIHAPNLDQSQLRRHRCYFGRPHSTQWQDNVLLLSYRGGYAALDSI